jgi:hypothetical protein
VNGLLHLDRLASSAQDEAASQRVVGVDAEEVFAGLVGHPGDLGNHGWPAADSATVLHARMEASANDGFMGEDLADAELA